MSANATATEAPLVLSRREGPVVRLTLNRGERFNPLSSATVSYTHLTLPTNREV